MKTMKKLNYIGFAAIALLAAACQKETEAPAEAILGGGRIYTAVIENDQTRSTVTESGETAKFNWEAGDPITVINADGASTDNLTLTINEGKAQFTLANVTEPKWATYPQIAKTYTAGELSVVTLPDVYNDYNGSTNAAMIADMSAGEDVANFRHIGGAIRLTLNKIPADCNKLVFVATGKKITGDFPIDFDKYSISTSSSDTESTVTFNFTAGTESRDFFIPVPTGDYTGIKFTLYTGETEYYTKESTKAFTVLRKELHTFPAVTIPLILTFDFNHGSGSKDKTDHTPNGPVTGWPVNNPGTIVEKTYHLDGTDYTFILSSKTRLMRSSDGKTTLVRIDDRSNTDNDNQVASNHYLGLPAIEGKKLVKVEILNFASGTRETVITDKEWNEVSTVQNLGEVKAYTFELTNTNVNEVYYISSKRLVDKHNGKFIGFTKATLYYE